MYNNSLGGVFMRDATGAPPSAWLSYNASGESAPSYFALCTDTAALPYTAPDAPPDAATPPLGYVVTSRVPPLRLLAADSSAGMPGVVESSLSWLEPRHSPLYGVDWDTDKTRRILDAFVAMAGVTVAEGVWGFTNLVTARDAALLRRAVSILRFLAPLTRQALPSPAPPTPPPPPMRRPAVRGRLRDPLPDGVLDLQVLPAFPASASGANATIVATQVYGLCPPSLQDVRGVGDAVAVNCTAFLVANYGPDDAPVVVLNTSLALAHVNTTQYTPYWYDLYRGTVLNASAGVITLAVEAGGIGAAVMTVTAASSALQAFLDNMATNVTAQPLSSFSTDWEPVNQTWVGVAPSPGTTTPPPGTVLIPGAGSYAFTIAAALPEPFSRPDAAPVVASGRGLDVQYWWEAAPQPQHATTLSLAPFYMDTQLVANEDFRRFMAATGYNASRPLANAGINFLRDWIVCDNGTVCYNATVRAGPKGRGICVCVWGGGGMGNVKDKRAEILDGSLAGERSVQNPPPFGIHGRRGSQATRQHVRPCF